MNYKVFKWFLGFPHDQPDPNETKTFYSRSQIYFLKRSWFRKIWNICFHFYRNLSSCATQFNFNFCVVSIAIVIVVTLPPRMITKTIFLSSWKHDTLQHIVCMNTLHNTLRRYLLCDKHFTFASQYCYGTDELATSTSAVPKVLRTNLFWFYVLFCQPICVWPWSQITDRSQIRIRHSHKSFAFLTSIFT